VRRSIPTALLALSLLAGSVTLATLPAGAAVTPDKISSVAAVPGPGLGEVTITWQQGGDNTTAFQIETAASSFSPVQSSMPKHGRHRQLFTVPASQRSVTLTAEQVSASGAPAASGNLMFYRVYALNEQGRGTAIRRYPYLRAVLPQPVPPKIEGTPLRAATFNVRTARATYDKRVWLTRVPDVAQQILTSGPGVVALQELGPWRADGRYGSTRRVGRQTASLERGLAKAGGKRYQLVRVNPYISSKKPHGSQGARILYDSDRYQLLHNCPETTKGKPYNDSCSFDMPLLPGTNEGVRRRAAYAKLQDRASGQKFWVVSAHFDHFHSSSAATERMYEAHRGRQAAAVADTMDQINEQGLPIIFGGDVNGWQNNPVADDAHETLTAKGYYDTASAAVRLDMDYPTVNHFRETLTPNPIGVGVRLDVVAVKGAPGAQQIQNVLTPIDRARPSDHNLVVSDLVL